jgi:endonuclease/exonuclease/phosphatase family metal-dependent hydrolase
MKIVSWNCNGALRKKTQQLSTLEADVYVIQECEDPKQTAVQVYKDWRKNYLWVGNNKNKGIGIFAREGISLELMSLDSGRLEYFLPCLVNNSFFLLAVWTREANSPTFKYIGQMWKYLQQYKTHFQDQDVVIIGDFNSNSCWDAWDRWWNHSDVVRELEELGIVSLYHAQTGEEQGKEKQATFYMYRKPEKPYHIDYAFISKEMLPGSIMKIGSPSDWMEFSDHMPLAVDLMANNSPKPAPVFWVAKLRG